MAADFAHIEYDQRDDGERPRGEAGSTSARLFVVVALAAVLGGFATIVWYAYDRYALTLGDEPPVLTADTSPVRVAPADPGGLQVAHQDRLVLLGQPPDTAADDTALRPGPEAPIPRPAPAERGGPAATPLNSAALPVFASDPTAAPRRDGQIAVPVAAPDNPPGIFTAALPARPVEALIARRAAAAPALSLDTFGVGAERRRHRMVPIIEFGDTMPLPAPLAEAGVVVEPAAGPLDAAGGPADEIAVAGPSPSRVAQIMALAGTLHDDPQALSRALASARGGSEAERAAPAGADGDFRREDGTYRVQLAAVDRADVTGEEWRRLNRLHGDLLGSLDLHVESVEVNGRTYHRIQAGPVDPPAARSLCDALRGRGAECLVRP